MEQRHRQFSLVYLLAALLLMAAMQTLLRTGAEQGLAYSDFKVLLKAGKLHDLVVGEREIRGTVDTRDLGTILAGPQADALRGAGGGERRFTTVRVGDPALTQDLEAAKIRFVGDVDSQWLGTLLSWVLPALIFVAIWGYFLRRMGSATGGLLEIGKSRARIYMQTDTGVTFADVAGIDEAKAELMEIVEYLKAPERFRRLGGKLPKGVLLLGAPGTGKTLLARAVAGEAGVPFFSISGASFVEMFVGVGAARVRDLFTQAEAKAPCIIFIDELDALGKARGFGMAGGNDEREQTLNQLLVQMDGFDTNKGVIIMAATNRPEILDPALLRAGRFDRHVPLDRPDLRGREQILQVHVRGVRLAPGTQIAQIAARTPGFAGADLANLVNEAALLAARRGKDAVDMADFDDALERIVGGLEKKNRVMNPLEKRIIAYHEAGHALVAENRPYADKVSRISIIPRGIAALGYTRQTPSEDRYVLRKSELLDRLDVLLGGRLAEELVFGDASTGAQDDLQRATDMARQMVTRYGMGEKLGFATYERLASPLEPDPAAAPREPRDYSERTAEAIDDEVRHLLADAGERVRQTLQTRRAELAALADLLLATEVVDRAALDALLHAPPAQTSTTPQTLQTPPAAQPGAVAHAS